MNPSRFQTVIIHLLVAMLALGLAGTSWSQDGQIAPKVDKGQLLEAEPGLLLEEGSADLSLLETLSIHNPTSPPVEATLPLQGEWVGNVFQAPGRYLETQPFTVPALVRPDDRYLVAFEEQFELESDWDIGYVAISNNGGSTWVMMGERTGLSGPRVNHIDVTAYAGQELLIRFIQANDESIDFRGWHVDNIQLVQADTASDPLDVAIASLDSGNFPFIYMNVNVESGGTGVPGLDESHFTVTENGALQENFFEVVPPSTSGGSRIADIVFVLDVSGSMGGELNAVKANMVSFINAIDAADIDYRIGIVVFADPYHVYNNGNLYGDRDHIISVVNNLRIGDSGVGGGGDGPENQLGAMAAGASMNYRTGAQRIQIMMTDATAHESDWVTPHTVESCLSVLQGAGINVYPVFYTGSSSQRAQYVPIAQGTNPSGSYYNILSNFNSIINDIVDEFGSTYVVRYRATNDEVDGVLRQVVVQVDHDGLSDQDMREYIPGTAPTITRTVETIAYSTGQVYDNLPLVFSCLVTDDYAPVVNSVKMFYRRTGTTEYVPLSLSHVSGDRWEVELPGSAVQPHGLDYYMQASDGIVTVTSPSVDPSRRPHQIAVRPNFAPEITHDPPTSAVPGESILVEAVIGDSTDYVENAWLLYREYGDLLYTEIPMTVSGTSDYSATIPASDVTLSGVQYEIRAEDNLGVGSVSGPHLVGVSPGPQCFEYGDLTICADFVNRISENVLEFSGNVNISEILYFTGNIILEETILRVTGDCGIYLQGIPTPIGPTDYTLYEGGFEFTLLGADGDLTNFINEDVNSYLAFAGMGIHIETIELIIDRQGVLIKGEMTLPPALKSAKIDVETLEITRLDGVQFTGCLDVQNTIPLPGGVGLKDIQLCYDYETDCFYGHAIASVKVVEIDGEATVCGGRLEGISLAVDISPGVPIGSTGFSLTGGSGQVQNLTNPPVLIGLTVDISGGPQIAGEYIVSFEELGLTIQYPDFIEGSGNLVVFGQDTATGSIRYGNEGGRRTFGVEGNIDFVNVLIVDSQAKITADDFWGRTEGILRVPPVEGFPFNLISGLLGLPYDVGNSEATITLNKIEGSAHVDIPLAPDVDFAYRVEFTPDFDIYLGTNYDNLVEVPIFLAAAGAEADMTQHYYDVPHNTPVMIITAHGETAPPVITAIAPNGERFEASTFGAIDQERFHYIADPGQNGTFLIIAHPLQGQWVVDTNATENVEIEVHTQSPDPTVQVVVENLGSSFRITTDVSSPVSGTIDLFFDDDDEGFDGGIIATGIPAEQGANVYTWIPTDVDSGDYFIHGKFSNGKAAPVHSYSAEAYSVVNPLAPAAPMGVETRIEDDMVKVSWMPVADVEGYAIHFRRAGETGFPNVRSLFDMPEAELPEFVAGYTYELAVRAYGTNGAWSAYSDVVAVQLISSIMNNAPEITSDPPNVVKFGEDIGYQVEAADPDGDGLIFGLANPLPGMTISPSGLVSWVPVQGQALTPRPVISVDDGNGGQDLQELTTQVVGADYGSAGLMLDNRVYQGNGALAWVTLTDADLALPEDAVVEVECPQTGGSTQVTCLPTSGSSDRYLGKLTLSTDGSGPGVLLVEEGSQVIVRFFDETSGEWVETQGLWVTEFPIRGSLDIDPDTLNQGSRGQFVTVYYEPPVPYVPEMVDVSLIMLEGVLAPEMDMIEILDHDGDGVMELAMKFDREAFQAVVAVGEEVHLSMSSSLYTELATLPILIGDEIRVIHPQVTSPAPESVIALGQPLPIEWTLTETTGVESVQVSVSLDGRLTWEPIAWLTGPALECTWDAPDELADAAYIMVDVYGSSGLVGSSIAGPYVVTGASGTDLVGIKTLAITGVVPNPFNPMTRIDYDVPTSGQVSLNVYDLSGRVVRNLLTGHVAAGSHSIVWNGEDNRGARLSSGTYIISIHNGRERWTTRAVLLK